jgi:asparagine synthase (glutamine-hydrolysing)
LTDTLSYLPDDLLVKVDLATMAQGLEARSPLLDPEVLELAASIPASIKFRDGTLKWLLKEAFRDEIPAPLLHRPKQGFSIPVHEWFRGPLRALVHDLLLAPGARIHAYLRPDSIASIVEDHLRRGEERGHVLWALLMLELWHREVIEAPVPARTRPGA